MEREIIGGEVWTDERGEAVVVLPDHLHSRELEYEYRLICTDPAEASVELAAGHLTITAAAPHLKVRWRLAYRTAGEPPCEGGDAR
jgi:hypothetical protein